MEKKAKKIRLDVYLFENSYFTSREKARIAIMEGKILVNGQKEDKPGTMIKDDSTISIIGDKLRYVSRGGLKLEKAVDVFKIDLQNKTCIDIGSSTGGFTDLMLQNGARKVYAVDCGTNQLDYTLRINEKVVVMENTNARYLTPENIGNDSIDFITVDVSFISLTKIIPVINTLLNDGGRAVMLIKPQFEAGKELVGEHGVVRDIDIHIDVVNKIVEFAKESGLGIIGLDFSPIKGPKGNIEYLLYVEKMSNVANDLLNSDIENVVKKSHEILDV